MNSLLNTNTPIVVCGDINFPNTNWDTNQSIDTVENNMLNELDRLKAEQVIRFPTRGRKTLDVVFAKDLVVNAQIDEKFQSCYNCSDHRPVSFDFYISIRKPKRLHDFYYSYGSANYDETRMYMNQNPFRPECFTNINRMNKEFETYCRGIIDMFVPRRTRHRQNLPVWYTSDTSNLLKRVETQTRLYQSKPTSYRKQNSLKWKNCC